jgi:hypothetical protein
MTSDLPNQINTVRIAGDVEDPRRGDLARTERDVETLRSQIQQSGSILGHCMRRLSHDKSHVAILDDRYSKRREIVEIPR